MRDGDANLVSSHEVVASYRPMLVNYLAKLCEDVVEAEDLAHETICIFLRHAAKRRKDPIRSPSQFLFGIARRVAIDWGRRRGREPQVFHDDCDATATHQAEADGYDEDGRIDARILPSPSGF